MVAFIVSQTISRLVLKIVVMTREQGTGNRFWATLLFVTYVGFFPFTYLLNDIKLKCPRFIYLGGLEAHPTEFVLPKKMTLSYMKSNMETDPQPLAEVGDLDITETCDF